MRNIAILTALALTAAACSTTTSNGVTTTTVNPVSVTSVGDAFTLAQAAAASFMAKNPALAADAQVLLKQMQAAFLQWVSVPTPTNAAAIALSVAVQDLTTFLVSHGQTI